METSSRHSNLQLGQKAARYAVRVYDEMSKRSQLLRQPTSVAQLEAHEVLPHLGALLGKGGFNCVYELERVALSSENEFPETQSQRRQLQSTQPKLAVKFLSQEALTSPDDFCNGAADLLMEANYLTALAAHPHPSLIRLHGVCAAGPAGFEQRGGGGYFILIDRLYDTLDRRIDVWREVVQRRRNDEKALKALFLQRLLVAQDIASALRHLHKLQIIFRDLKPDNVGFDYEGRVKLFDFGLAKELDPMQEHSQHENGALYNMSGGTGSRRFMAPEVNFSEPYGLSADLYSFGIMLWEIVTLEKAFGRMSVEEHIQRVVKGKERLELDPTWSDNLQDIMEGCWQRNPFQRPTAKEAYKSLRYEVQRVIAEEFPKQATTEEERRRSRTFSNR